MDTNQQRISLHASFIAPPPAVHLTAREREVLLLLGEGLSNKLIARRLGISLATVKIHVSSILGELAVSSRLQAVVRAQALGLFEVDCTTEAAIREGLAEAIALTGARIAA